MFGRCRRRLNVEELDGRGTAAIWEADFLVFGRNGLGVEEDTPWIHG